MADVEKLKQDLAIRDIQVQSVQRNYEGLSRCMQQKQEEAANLKTLLTAERNRNIDLSVRIDDALKQYGSVKQRLKQAEQWKTKFENLRKESAQSQFMSNLVASSQAALQEKINSLSFELKEATLKNAQTTNSLHTMQKNADQNSATIHTKNEEIEVLTREVSNLLRQIGQESDGLARAQKQIAQEKKTLECARRAYRQKEMQAKEAQEKVRELEAVLRELEAQHSAQTVLLTTCKEKEHALESHLSSTTRSLELQIGENQCGEKKITELQGKMRQVVQENKQLREENERFQKGLVDAQRRADENGVSSRKADDNLRGLREELDSSQADLQRLRKEKQEVHMQLEALQVQLHEIEKDREQIIKAYQCHLIWTMEKLDEPEGRLCVCLEKATTAIINVQEDFESLRNGHLSRFLHWEACISCIISKVASFGKRIEQCQKKQKQSLKSSERKGEGLLAEIEALQRKVQHETDQHHILEMEKSTREQEHASIITEMMLKHDSELKQQHTSLLFKLQSIETEVDSLKSRWLEGKKSLEDLALLEKDKGIRDVNDLCAKLSSLEEQGAKILKASDEAVAQVHTRYKREIDQLRREFEGQLTIGKAEADESDGCMDRALEIIGSIGNDIVLVDSHLKKMGLTERRQESLEMMGSTKSNTKPGEVLNSVQSLRLQFTYVTEHFQDMVSALALRPYKNSQQVHDASKNLEEKLELLRSTVDKLNHVEESMQSNFSCLICLKIFQSPVICVPCGHSYCKTCLRKHEMKCCECSEVSVETYMPNRALDMLCSKYKYQKDVLDNIREMCTFS